jgi:hypothetical protein
VAAARGATILGLAVLLLSGGIGMASAQQGPGGAANDTIPAERLEAGAGETPDSETAEADSVPAAAQLDAQADSILQLLRGLPGFVVTEYQSENATYRADTGILRLEGQATVSREQERLMADTIVFRDREDLVAAYGNARVTGTQELDSDSLFYDLARRRATAMGARTELQEGATWYVRGDVTLEGTRRLFASHGHFTSCDLEIPHYHFEADQVMVIRDRILVARPARLYFGNVPVMVLPFIVQSLEQGRRSGFLTPRFGLNDIVRASSGYNRQVSDVGFYWAINEYMGALLSMTWRSGAYTSMRGNLDYNWRRQFLNGNVSLERYWRADGRRELGLNAASSWQPDERTNIGLSARYASSGDFVREASYDPREVTQDLNSSFSFGRQLSWGRLSVGGDRRQSIATGDVSMTLPSFSFSPNGITLFRAPTPESQRWYSNASITPGVISGSRQTNSYSDNLRTRQQDREVTRLSAGPSFSVGNFTLNANGDLNRASVLAAAGVDSLGNEVNLSGYDRDEASWSASASYRLPLVGTTSIAPTLSWRQDLVRDTLSDGELVGAPIRMSFGAGLSTDLYGFFPGFGNFSAIRHRMSPRISYSYAPAVVQTALQEAVFGQRIGRAQNLITVGFNQTWEAKLRTPPEPEEPRVLIDSITGDTIPQSQTLSVPSDPGKVTLLSINTSSFVYDFVRAREEGSGFVTETVSNTINSDFLRGLTIQMQHELFDRSQLDPSLPGNVGRKGRFSPRLTSLSTSFELGPQTALIRWIDRLTFGRRTETGEEGQVLPGEPESDDPVPEGQGAFTGNPLGTGGGPWRVTASYSFSRNPRLFSQVPIEDRATQTLDGGVTFQLTPNWSVDWNTSYSLNLGEFGAHRLNFRRDIHEWQANFNFFQTPYGNTGFEFYVELTHNRDLKFDYRESNLGIDRRR